MEQAPPRAMKITLTCPASMNLLLSGVMGYDLHDEDPKKMIEVADIFANVRPSARIRVVAVGNAANVYLVVTIGVSTDMPTGEFLAHFGTWTSNELLEHRGHKGLKPLLAPHVHAMLRYAAELVGLVWRRTKDAWLVDVIDADAVSQDFDRMPKNQTTKSRRPTKKGNKKK